MRHESKTRSLTRQTIGIVLAAQVLCTVLLCCGALLNEWHTRFRAFDVRIQGRSDSLLGAIQDAEDADDNVTIDPTELKIPEKDVYAVYNQGGRLLGTSAGARSSLIARGEEGFRDARADGKSYRVLQREALRIIDRAENGGIGLRRPVTIVYASPEGFVWREILEAVRFYLIMILLAATLCVVFVMVRLRRALRPLSDLAEEAARISAPSLDFNAPTSVLQIRELRPLADVLTDTVSRLRESFLKEHRFVGDAAHELKTAIAVIRSSVQVLMLRQRSGEEYRAGLERILEDNLRVEAIVSQMLQLARLEEVRKAEIADIDVGEAVGSVVAQLQPISNEYRVEVHAEIFPKLLVRILPEAAQILASNLLLNAIQHSKPASSVSLSARPTAAGGVSLEVADTGSGIGPEALPHIFERFYREDTSRSRETGGTGLGLAICKSIVDVVGGTIEVESSVGLGTKVTVTFLPA
ncbi:MAG: HAMP domain-containing histidine kinase [Acidobacteriota bacterium]|nr:HAMP domain-containing histidine kinase [Acidobacteriota bacterium]